MNECGAIPKRSAKKVTKFEAMLRRIVASGPIYRAAASTKTDRACTRRILFLSVGFTPSPASPAVLLMPLYF